MEVPEHLKINEPNDEQRVAVEHTGGVLLSAGAGSGKTFVLVEHMVYLFKKEYENLAQPDIIEFSKRLKDRFSKIVLMTFTKKAAGELSLRLQKRFEKGLERANHNLEKIPAPYWEAAQSAVNYMFVGTIHSFCYRLILEGHIPGFTGNEEMVSDLELTDKIKKLFSLWIEKNEDKLKDQSLEFIIVNKKLFQAQLKSIFSDTDLRLLWTKFDEQRESKDNFSLLDQIEEFYNLEVEIDWEDLRAPIIGEERMPKKKSAWVTFLEDFDSSVDRSSLMNFLNSILEIYKNYGRHPSVGAKKNADDIKAFLSQVKNIRDFANSYLDDFTACLENESLFLKYGDTTFDIYSFIESNYLRVPGLTFTDLEYYVWKAVTENSQVVEQIASNYDYFIIDEFQDTSNVQFEVVKSITQNDMGKIFSVGDVKQAIYGFRGGELGVFKEASETTYQTLDLKNNYRSDSAVIEFNNQLFKFLLPLGTDFYGEDPYTVPMLEQSVPSGKEGTGEVSKHVLAIEGELPEGKRSITPMELNYLECQGIFNYLLESPDGSGASQESEEVCVLYRKLTPVKFLIGMLLNSELGFTCQVKVNLEEDPIIYLFCEYARALSMWEKPGEIELSALIFDRVLQILNFHHSQEEIISYLTEGYEHYLSLGFWDSFKSFLWRLSLSSSNLDLSYDLLKFLSEQGGDQAELIYEKLKQSFSGEQYSIDFQSGDNPERIKIMTMHASKGLEFGTVILGGIHTNGIEKSDANYFGKLPYSYKWFLSAKKSHVFRSPRYLTEEFLKKKKSFSEAKRLFYVAGTRAVHKLVWFDIEHDKKPLSHGKSSWVNGIREWEGNIETNNIEIFESLKSAQKIIPLNLSKIDLLDQRLDLHPPIFHIDSLGVTEVEKVEPVSLGYSSELSVTRLAEITRCPRKFFLKNLVKISEEEVGDLLKEEEPLDEVDKISEFENNSEDLFHRDIGRGFRNSSERGTLVHERISQMILHNRVIPRESGLDELGLEGVSWVRDQLEEILVSKKSKQIKFYSETPIKFSLFGQMISGTPDFYILGDNYLEVWDFKTGRVSEEKMAPYWFQLLCYAHALSTGISEESPIKLVLSFVDEKRNLEKEYTISEITDLLYEQWKKTENPDQINKEHCQFCLYEKLCFPTL
ncbi:MAG: hypothetical protein CME63_10425 [Halobacteriovoraceae bacterium]|nr:hypothetical protein [Halobacteriovoraceae bacterium]|tara:strand:+ start:49720 stop:53151 length:3432 start_codon:yes stop_codon:yes gene_type:complete